MADTLAPRVEDVSASQPVTVPAEDASAVGGWPHRATSRHLEDVPNGDGTLIVGTVWLVAYLFMALSYYLSD